MKIRSIGALTAVALLAACTTTNPYTGESQISRTAGGATLGAAAGALGGVITANATGGNARIAALIGAGVGALAGGAVGAYMDQQEAELRAQLQGTGISVTRVGDQIILNMPSNITFDVDSSAVKPAFNSTLQSVALVLNKYNKTLVDVYGHTDSDGSEEYNLNLSRQRAVAVANVIAGFGVDPRRFYVDGKGESQPIASNNTEAGKAANRRVEIQISPLRAS
ncbi:MAG: OmpA family protein [Hyphomicrobiaceae bacterium]|nr:OmpA family protein [Hyphomicrobiaceae bacterium]